MGKRLIEAFAVEDPGRFAHLLGSIHDIDEAIEILNRIPDGTEGEVLANLKPEAADRILNGLPEDLLAAWLGNCSTEVGRRLIAAIGAERSEQVISRIKNPSKRRGLKRMVTYPAGSIGAHMHHRVVSLTGIATAEEVEKTYRGQQLPPDCPGIILGADERVIGLLDLAAFVGNDDEQARASEFCIRVRPVHAESPIASLLEKEVWQQLSTLPVVDFQDRLVGYITRSDLQAALETATPGNTVLESAVELSSRYMQFLAYMLTLIISRRTEN